jgi:hypothetical protein
LVLAVVVVVDGLGMDVMVVVCVGLVGLDHRLLLLVVVKVAGGVSPWDGSG